MARREDPFNPFNPDGNQPRRAPRRPLGREQPPAVAKAPEDRQVGGDLPTMEVEVCLRDRPSTRVTVALPGDATALAASDASGLIARDGTPYRCFDSEDRVIGDIQLKDLSSDIFLGVPREIVAVMIEETANGGHVGRGRLMDGTTVYVPGVKAGEFAWVVVSGRYGPGQKKANAFRVRMEGPPFKGGDYIRIKPRPGADRVRIFNPQTCQWDLRMDIRVPTNVNQSEYDGLTWTVRISQTNPLVGILDTRLTFRPENQPELARRARKKHGIPDPNHA